MKYSVAIDGIASDTYVYGQEVTAKTYKEKTTGGTNVVCCGWVGSGDVPSSGTATQVTFTVTQPSSLRWLYATNYWFEAHKTSGGSVTVDKSGFAAQIEGGWVPVGASVVLVATPNVHWHFTGWTETSSGKGISNDAHHSFAITEAQNVTARFAIDTCTVTFDLDGHGTKGSGSLSQTVEYGAPATAPTVIPNAGYRFTGWNRTYSAITADTTVTAQYEAIEYTITYQNVQGCANSNPTRYTIEDSVTFGSLTGRTGWRFLGWSPTQIPKGTIGNKTVQASWAANNYSLSFNANGGTGNMNALRMTYDAEAAITSNQFVRTGYVFLGWSTTENGPVEYQNGVKVLNLTATHNGTVTLYAVWEELVVPAPSIAPVDGATFSTDSCEVSLACSMEGAAIYYTTNGTTPKVSASCLYTQPFKVYGTVSVKAVAVVDTVKSAYATATINKVDPVPVATPVITPADGATFSSETCEVTIMCPTDGATIYYTTDGKTPKTTDTYRYNGPFVISSTATIKAVATKDGWLKSVYATATITKVSLTLEGVLGGDSRVNVTTGGAADWLPVNDAQAKEGGSSARSGLGHNDDNSESWIQLTVTGKGTLSFWYKTSCEHDDDNAYSWDRVEATVDGVARSDWRMDGESQWVPRTVAFEAGGEHNVRIVYIKDGSDYDGEDCAWLDGVVWTPSAADPIPDIGDTPSAADVAAAVADAKDSKVSANIDKTNYNDFRDWAGKVKSKGGIAAGAQGVMNADNAWLSYALGQDVLLDTVPADGDLSVEAFKPAAEAGKFDFTVSVKDIEVGTEAAKENLKKVFGLEGATMLKGSAFSSDTVDIEFGTPVDGKVKFTATPKETNAKSFFMRVKMLP